MTPATPGHEGDVVIRDPRALRALAHPDRLSILERLQGDGPATATVLGETIGISPSAASYHLRLLARFGLVEDAGGGRGRNRPWRAVGTGFRIEPAELGPASAAAGQALAAALVMRGERETLAFLAAESTIAPAWQAASHLANKTLLLTPDEAADLVRRLEDAVEPYLRSRRHEAPDDARVARLLLRLFPRDVEAP
jgi:DNA-binding transcriptional ArsR family regulator